MKALFLIVLIFLANFGCQSEAGRIRVVTSTGREELATRRYTIREIEAGSVRQSEIKDPFQIEHPIYPSKKELEALRQHMKKGDDIWYFRGLDSGWAVVREHKVVWVLVTSHEY